MGDLLVGAAVEGFEFGTVHGAEEVAHVDEVEFVGPGPEGLLASPAGRREERERKGGSTNL